MKNLQVRDCGKLESENRKRACFGQITRLLLGMAVEEIKGSAIGTNDAASPQSTTHITRALANPSASAKATTSSDSLSTSAAPALFTTLEQDVMSRMGRKQFVKAFQNRLISNPSTQRASCNNGTDSQDMESIRST